MALLDDWQSILRRAWSVRLMILAGALSGAEVALPLFAADLPRGAFAAASGLVVMLAFMARLVAQKEMSE